MAQVILQGREQDLRRRRRRQATSRFTVEDGEFVALVGPSGCGKTTTLNLIAGLIPLTAGEIVIGDREVNDLDPKDRDIAMVFQNYALYPNKTVFKNLAFPLQMRKQPKAEIDRKVREAARGARHHPPARAPPARALRRPAAARRPRPRAGARPRGLPDGRAALQPRRQAARADALGDQALPSQPQRHHRLRHPRPARGRHHGRQDGGDASAACCSSTTRPPTCSPTRSTPSSPASSAARR